MLEWNIDRLIAIGLALFAIALGMAVTLAMDAKTRGEYRFAAGCFVFSALMLASTIGLWEVNTDSTAFKRLLISASLFALIGVSIVEAIRWTRGRHMRAATSASVELTIPPPQDNTPKMPAPPLATTRQPRHHPKPKPHMPLVEHGTVAVDSSTVKTTERLDGGLDFEIVVRIKNGPTENEVTLNGHNYFDGEELLPAHPERKFDMLPNQMFEATWTPFLGRVHAIDFKALGKPLVIKLTLDYNDGGTKMQYVFEGQAELNLNSLDILKSERRIVH